jgi:hypothetical protein
VPVNPGNRRVRHRVATAPGLSRVSNETIFRSRRSRPETEIRSNVPIRQWGSIMLALILNSIYREILKSSLSGIRKVAAG